MESPTVHSRNFGSLPIVSCFLLFPSSDPVGVFELCDREAIFRVKQKQNRKELRVGETKNNNNNRKYSPTRIAIVRDLFRGCTSCNWVHGAALTYTHTCNVYIYPSYTSCSKRDYA